MIRVVCIIALALVEAVHSKEFQIKNQGSKTIWVGILGSQLLNDGGFQLSPGQTVTVQAGSSWSGRVWARTGCSFDASGHGPCDTGDCGNQLKCNGAGGVPPVSLAEFTLGNLDFYDVSFVDGFNVPVQITALGGNPDPNNPQYSCKTAGCTVNLLMNCPNELRMTNSAGQTVACRSACNKYATDQYCCGGIYGTPSTCNPNTWAVNSAAYFKSNCPAAYSYAYDDGSSTFICPNNNAGYEIIFS